MGTDASTKTAEKFVKIPVKGATPDLKRYVWVHLIRLTDREAPGRVEEATEYLKKVTAEMFEFPPCQQASVYYDPFQAPHGRNDSAHRYWDGHSDATPPDFLIMFRFLAVDYARMKKRFVDAFDEVMAVNPLPDYLTVERAHFYVENHRQERHEPFKGPVAIICGDPNAQKWISYGMSQCGPGPGCDASSAATQVMYADFYQEVRQHDVLRGSGLGYENGHQWLLEEDEDWPEGYTFSIYENAFDDHEAYWAASQGTYAFMTSIPAHADNGLYYGMYGGLCKVVDEHFKEY